MRIIPVAVVSDADHFFIHYPLVEFIGAAADNIARLGSFIAKFIDNVLINGDQSGMRQHLQEIGDRFHQRHFHRLGIEGFNALFIRIFLTVYNILRVEHLHVAQIICIGRGRDRVNQPTPAEDHILRGNGIAIRPG